MVEELLNSRYHVEELKLENWRNDELWRINVDWQKIYDLDELKN